MSIQNRLSTVRKHRGLTAARLAERTGITRQTIHAIESGNYVPNTAIALRLARELEVTVEQLFSLPPDLPGQPPIIDASLLASKSLSPGKPVGLSKVGADWVAAPASPALYFFPECDGVVTGAQSGKAQVQGFYDGDFEKRLVIAGCDPAIGMLSRMVEQESGIGVLTAPASSRLALEWLKQGRVHIAGAHLEDEKTGQFNVPYIRRTLPGIDLVLVTFARWEEGFVVAPGNPKSISGIASLVQRNIRFRNRERGSGSRTLLDRLLKQAGIKRDSLSGYRREAVGHLAAAAAVLSGEADCCLATSSAARAFGLDFVPLRQERFDFAMRKDSLAFPGVRALLDLLQRASLRNRLQSLAGYDTADTGSMVTEAQPGGSRGKT